MGDLTLDADHVGRVGLADAVDQGGAVRVVAWSTCFSRATALNSMVCATITPIARTWSMRQHRPQERLRNERTPCYGCHCQARMDECRLMTWGGRPRPPVFQRPVREGIDLSDRL